MLILLIGAEFGVKFHAYVHHGFLYPHIAKGRPRAAVCKEIECANKFRKFLEIKGLAVWSELGKYLY